MEAPLDRIAVVGTSCAGKTTFARRLAERLAAPHVQLDTLFWTAGWVARPREEFRERVRGEVAGERWVCDGNFSSVRDLVWARAQAVIWLRYSFPLVLARALRRTVGRIVSRSEVFPGCRESFRKSFLSRGSILLWVLQT